MSKQYLKESSVGMAVMDALPVLFFCGTIALLANIWRSPLFFAGGICCIAAGAGKVLWKLILAITKKNMLFLNRQFRYLMSGGFLLIVISLIINRNAIDGAAVRKNLLWFPGNICFLIGIFCFVLMMVLAVKMDASSKRANWLEQSVNLVAELAIFFGVLLIWYASDSYQADQRAFSYMNDTETVTVKEIDDGLFFDGAGEESALIFYPGAKVEYTAYAPLMEQLAEDGVDVFLLEMPYNMAIFGINRADDLMAEYDYAHWYVGGHSLGGAMAASYSARHLDKLDGLVLLAAYPTKSLQADDFSVVSIYGSEDRVLNPEKLEKGRAYMPEDYEEICIEGGNHAWFGSYGEQAGDGTATISHEEQWEAAESAMLEMIAQ